MPGCRLRGEGCGCVWKGVWVCGHEVVVRTIGALQPGYNVPHTQSSHEFRSTFLFMPAFPLFSGSCIRWPGLELSLIEASGDTFQR